jgi:ABC-type Na+ transport system ATPase subunit NatA
VGIGGWPGAQRAPRGVEVAGLSREERQRLAKLKLRYELERFLERQGFSSGEARRLMFARWLVRRGAIGG